MRPQPPIVRDNFLENGWSLRPPEIHGVARFDGAGGSALSLPLPNLDGRKWPGQTANTLVRLSINLMRNIVPLESYDTQIGELSSAPNRLAVKAAMTVTAPARSGWRIHSI
jgi:hypothetical protein